MREDATTVQIGYADWARILRKAVTHDERTADGAIEVMPSILKKLAELLESAALAAERPAPPLSHDWRSELPEHCPHSDRVGTICGACVQQTIERLKEERPAPQPDPTLLDIAGLVNAYHNDGTHLSAAETLRAIADALGKPFERPAPPQEPPDPVPRSLHDIWYQGYEAGLAADPLAGVPRAPQEPPQCDDCHIVRTLAMEYGWNATGHVGAWLRQRLRSLHSLLHADPLAGVPRAPQPDGVCPECGHEPLSRADDGLRYCPQPPEGCGNYETRGPVPHRVKPPRL